VAKPVLAELLRFIAANEQLPLTLHRYSGYDRDTLGKLINAAADRLEEAEKAREAAAPGGSKGIKVRKQSDVEKAAARSAAELDEAMDLSKTESRPPRPRPRSARSARGSTPTARRAGTPALPARAP
jgi:ribonuclease HI